MKTVRLYEVNSSSPARDITTALRAASAEIKGNKSVLRTRPWDVPLGSDPNQYLWVLPHEIHDEEEPTVQFRKHLEDLAHRGILEMNQRHTGLRFRPKVIP